MKVKITTISKKTFEGILIGVNADKILCVIGKNNIKADLLDNIAEIIEITDA